ncbi:putative hemolysin [Sulfitobacter undariae]|uniref:Putative hemolysin n=1 Tax=Sulfitobacter undariae TaxID=1563671 RepID=A0A7W6E849_9RHOB|nr:lysophospholipid acyltransferase family protein [Sulfitobacter undariae]MBB3993795.1 putative hemolysin [Sulfitobacter undariae]
MSLMQLPPTARDLSYAWSAQTRSGQAVIRLMENATGRIGLIKRARGYEAQLAAGANFFEVMAERYGLTLDVAASALSNVPRQGPLIVIANHPYGILDGLMMGHVLSRTRPDFKIMASSVFGKVSELQSSILPINFAETKEAVAMNLETRRTALESLGNGGAVGIFPGGTVSTGVKPFSHPMDPNWRSFTARMISKSDATILPIYFDGHTSRMFQIASHLHATLRMGLLIKEFRKRVDTPVRMVIGEPINRDVLKPMSNDAKGMMDFLRKATYELAPEPLKSFDAGYEFEDRHRSR